MTRLRIAIVAESFLPSVNGVANSVARVVEVLAAAHEVLVVAPRPGGASFAGARIVRVPSLPLPGYRGFPVGVPTPRLVATLDHFRPDVLHLASPAVLGARAAAWAHAQGVPTVAVYQTDLVGFARRYRLGMVGPALWGWMRRLHDMVDRTLAPSRAAALELRRHGIPSVHRWGRGVDLASFAPSWRTRPPTAQVPRVRVGYVGRLAAEKSVEHLAQLQDVPGVDLVVVGDGPRRKRLERRLNTAAFTGQLIGPALSAAFADLDVFVHTGAHETFCQAAQEALASGVPVSAPAAGGLLDLVEHGRTGLLWRPDRPQDIRELVTRLAGAPAMRAAMGHRARASVRLRTWPALTVELAGHYLEVIAERRRPEQAA